MHEKLKSSGSGLTFLLLRRELLLVVRGPQESAGHGLENTKVRAILCYRASPSDGLGVSGKGEQKSSKIHLVNCAVALEEKPPTLSNRSPILKHDLIFLIEDTTKLTVASWDHLALLFFNPSFDICMPSLLHHWVLYKLKIMFLELMYLMFIN